MDANLSLLQRATGIQVCTEPFPHLVLEQALPSELCGALLANYPAPAELGVDLKQSNTRWSVGYATARQHPAVPPLWRSFLAYHSSQDFLDEILALFGPHLCALYPERFAHLVSLKGLRAGVRGVTGRDQAEVLMDAQLSGNTPVRQRSSVRGLHVDKGDKLFSGLFYLRPDGDHSDGGDLEIHRFRPALSSQQRARAFQEYSVDPAAAEWVTTIPYRRNTLVLFLNSLHSLHGVSPREPTGHCRLFLNLVGEVHPPLYRYPRPESRFSPWRLGKQLRRWLGPSASPAHPQ